MNSGKMARRLAGLAAVSVFLNLSANADETPRFVQVAARSRDERSAIANEGVAIELVRTDSVWVLARARDVAKLRKEGFKILSTGTALGAVQARGGFPSGDERFHTYDQTLKALQDLSAKNADITSLSSIGKSVEGRDLWALHINTSARDLAEGTSGKPGAIFMGDHHAREHVSVEIPLMLAQYLLNNRRDPRVSKLLDTRDIWVIPMVNPDGAEYDISGSISYKWWRKNRRNNGDGTYGVDLNRNYGYFWGTGGSDTDTSSETYMGPAPFSEPETQHVRDFVEAHLNAKVLLTFHTFSELILYPWGHTNDAISNARDEAVFETMAKKMAGWNGYTPEQSSALYIASGDTTDWAYGTHGIFAFTFELSPRDMWSGGFYPGEGVIDTVFKANLQPCLYMLTVADDPYQVLNASDAGQDDADRDDAARGLLKSYVEP